ncbi:hypothetical protein GCM10017779_42630 [Streptomyces capillispiralis]|nr:hypothetical protein GCM10017779_42630 [Streptomyces capillispiralis]
MFDISNSARNFERDRRCEASARQCFGHNSGQDFSRTLSRTDGRRTVIRGGATVTGSQDAGMGRRVGSNGGE